MKLLKCWMLFITFYNKLCYCVQTDWAANDEVLDCINVGVDEVEKCD